MHLFFMVSRGATKMPAYTHTHTSNCSVQALFMYTLELCNSQINKQNKQTQLGSVRIGSDHCNTSNKTPWIAWIIMIVVAVVVAVGTFVVWRTQCAQNKNFNKKKNWKKRKMQRKNNNNHHSANKIDVSKWKGAAC